MKKYLPYFITAVTALVLDQISKLWILAHFQFAERLNIIPGFFALTLVYNPGAAFSFLAVGKNICSCCLRLPSAAGWATKSAKAS